MTNLSITPSSFLHQRRHLRCALLADSLLSRNGQEGTEEEKWRKLAQLVCAVNVRPTKPDLSVTTSLSSSQQHSHPSSAHTTL